MPDFLLCLESKREPSVAKEQNYMGGGDTAHAFLMSVTNGVGTPYNIERKHIVGGGHHTYFVGVGTLHNIYRKSLALGGWVVPVRE